LWHGYLDFYEADLSVEQTALTWSRLTDPDYPIWGGIATDDAGNEIGFVHWLTHAATWSDRPYCYLEDLFVAPDARGSGAGRALIAHVTDWARENGCTKVYWLTQETNTTARALYERVAKNTGFVHYEIGLEAS
jgi:GNAT superfamily N-acetyltransferase